MTSTINGRLINVEPERSGRKNSYIADLTDTAARHINIRHVTLSDMDAAIELEARAWPKDVRATPAQLVDRVKVFPAGFYGAFAGSRLVGMASSLITYYRDGEPLKSWTDITANGWIRWRHVPSGNALYFVSVCVHPHYRGHGIGTALNRARLDLASAHNLDYVFTNARMPGVATFLRSQIDSSVEDYLHSVRNGFTANPVIAMYMDLGFRVLGVVPNCMESDDESADYGLAMLKDLSQSDIK